MNRKPHAFILLALILLVTGAVLPFLMVIGVLPSTFVLNFVTYFASVVGLFLGFIGIAFYVGDARKKDDWQDY